MDSKALIIILPHRHHRSTTRFTEGCFKSAQTPTHRPHQPPPKRPHGDKTASSGLPASKTALQRRFYQRPARPWLANPATQTATGRRNDLLGSTWIAVQDVQDVQDAFALCRVARVARVARACRSIFRPRRRVNPRNVSAGFGLGILAAQFGVRFHLGEQGMGFVRAADNSRPIHIGCLNALGFVRQQF